MNPSTECPAIKGTFIVFPSPGLVISFDDAHDLLPFLPRPAVESDCRASDVIAPVSRGRVSFDRVWEGDTLGFRRSRPRVGVCGLAASREAQGAEREHDEYRRRMSMLIGYRYRDDKGPEG